MWPAHLVLFLIAFASPSAAQPASRTCYSAAETREKIIEEKLAAPFPLMRAQAAENRAEAIAVRLCHTGAAWLYEIDLLRRDGRLIHTNLDAVTGKPVDGVRK